MVNKGTGLHYYGLFTALKSVMWIVGTLAILGFVALCLIIGLSVLHRRHLYQREQVLLELTPPRSSSKTPFATSQLLAILHELTGSPSLRDRVLQRKAILSFEVVSSKSSGIRYLMYVPESDAGAIRRSLMAYLPDARIKKVKNYLQNLPKTNTIKALEFTQTRHPALPLTTPAGLDEHDPIAYMAGAMTQLKTGELIVFQVVVSPTPGRWLKRQSQHLRSAQLSQDNHHRFVILIHRALRLSARIILRVVYFIRFFVLDVSGHQPAHHDRGRPVHADGTETLQEAIQNKLHQPLFQANIRILVVAQSEAKAAARVRGLQSAVATFDRTGYQSLRVSHTWISFLNNRWYTRNIENRLPSLWPSSHTILSTTELSSLYHFPYGNTYQTENLVTSLSRSLPAPISLKGTAKYDVLLGQNNHQGIKTPIGLTAIERERHVYLVGGTGNGKTTLLQYAIIQDINNHKGLAVIDPHGDLAESILKYIPKNRLGDVIYFNPDDVTYPIGLNLLEIPAGLNGDELIREKDLITETVISVFRKIFSEDDSGGHRIEYILRNTIQTALTMENATLFTIFNLLTNAKFRKQAVSNLTDQDLQDFWNNEMGKAGEFQRIKMSAGITAKVGRFLFSGSAKRVLSQPTSTIDFDDIINSGKILICNFSKGLLGEDTAALFGITVLAKLQIATLRRARLPITARQPFHLYVDEFQNFATLSFVQMLSEARKYKLFLTMAEQSTTQQPEERIVNIILANVGTVICFRSASPIDEQVLLPLFSPFIQAGEITYLSPFHFYIRIAAAAAQEPFSGETIRAKPPRSVADVHQVIESSRTKYALRNVPSLVAEHLFDVDDYEIDAPLALS